MLIFRRADNGGDLAKVFRGHLASGVSAGATQFDLDAGEGELLPELAEGETLVLRLGSDSGFRPVVITGRSGDTLYCEALDRDWPMGTHVVAAVLAEILEAFVQREELGDAAGMDVGTTAGTVAAGDALPAHIAAEDPHPQYLTEAEADARYVATGSSSGVDVTEVWLFT
jgi:hypothetical protein